MKVWLVHNDGEIMGVFSNEKAAKHFAEVHDYDDIDGPMTVHDTYPAMIGPETLTTQQGGPTSTLKRGKIS
jgi:hypothetical protein